MWRDCQVVQPELQVWSLVDAQCCRVRSWQQVPSRQENLSAMPTSVLCWSDVYNILAEGPAGGSMVPQRAGRVP